MFLICGYTMLIIYYSQKVRETELLGKIYGKCQKAFKSKHTILISPCQTIHWNKRNSGGYTTTGTTNASRALFTMKQSSAWDVAKGPRLICLSVTPPVSLCLCCNPLMTSCDTLSSMATSLWEHPFWSLIEARHWWSIVRCCVGLMMKLSFNQNI